MRGERRTFGVWPWVLIALAVLVTTIVMFHWPLVLITHSGYGAIIPIAVALIIAMGFTLLVVTIRDIWLEIQYNEN